MKLASPNPVARCGALAYTVAEVMIAVFIVAIVGLSLYAGFTAGFGAVRLSRENLRATQVMVRRMETIRLYAWSQATNTTSYVQPTFYELYDPLGATNNSVGMVYAGQLSESIPTNVPSAYRTNMRALTVTVYWTNQIGNNQVVRSRQMQTFVARYGMQNYIFGPP